MAEEEDAGVDQVEEEYTVWKKNTPFLYDLIVSQPLEWPSLTVHCVPSSPRPHTHPSLAVHQLIFGTHTSEGFPNFLIVADALLPAKASEPIVDSNFSDPIIPKVLHLIVSEGFLGIM